MAINLICFLEDNMFIHLQIFRSVIPDISVQISNSFYSHFVLEILMNDLVHDSVELDYTIS
jgi:hypothetical protein